MGSLWCDMTSVVSQNLFCERSPSEARATERNGHDYCTAPQMIPTANDPQTGNDPQIGPQMIPNRK